MHILRTYIRWQSASSMATKRQSADYREKLWLRLPCISPLTTEREALAKATTCQSAERAQAMATKRQSADYREREAQAMPCHAMVTKRQSADYRERSSG